MLVFARKSQQAIVIDGRITVKVLEILPGSVRLGIEAAREIPVHRKEVQDVIELQKSQPKSEPKSLERSAKDGPPAGGHA